MYVEFNKSGYEVLEDDGTVLKRFLSKSAATTWMRDMNDAVRSAREIKHLDQSAQDHHEWRNRD